jgi:hypothetical protein
LFQAAVVQQARSRRHHQQQQQVMREEEDDEALSPQSREELRLRVNCRERQRMHDLNAAMDSLREVKQEIKIFLSNLISSCLNRLHVIFKVGQT